MISLTIRNEDLLSMK